MDVTSANLGSSTINASLIEWKLMVMVSMCQNALKAAMRSARMISHGTGGRERMVAQTSASVNLSPRPTWSIWHKLSMSRLMEFVRDGEVPNTPSKNSNAIVAL
jgi:hypothetical protein